MDKTILIVEDNEASMRLMLALLEEGGYTTLQASEGTEALELARTHEPDLILMDIHLPNLSGLDVTRKLKADERLCEIPIVAVTAFAMKGDRERFEDCGCDGYITKPVAAPDLLETVRMFLR